MELHYVQERILKILLKSSKKLRYSELRPENIEDDTFRYHLNKMVGLKYICKEQNGYLLTSQGMKLTEEVAPIGVMRKKADTFKLYSHGIVCKFDNGNLHILNRRRTKHPFYGDTGILGASVRKGEESADALIRRLESQTGLRCEKDDLRLAGILRKITHNGDGELFSDFIFYMYLCFNPRGALDSQRDNGNVFWVPIEQAIENEKNAQHPFPSLLTILEEIQTQSLDNLKRFSVHISEDTVQVRI